VLVEFALGEAEVVIVLPSADGGDDGKLAVSPTLGNLLGFFYELGTETEVLGFGGIFFAEGGGGTVDVDFTNDGRVFELGDKRGFGGKGKTEKAEEVIVSCDELEEVFLAGGGGVAEGVEFVGGRIKRLVSDFARTDILEFDLVSVEMVFGDLAEVGFFVAGDDVG